MKTIQTHKKTKAWKRKDIQFVEYAIEKWEDIAIGEGEDHGPDNCALCEVYYDDKCEGCPIFEDTGSQRCCDTPYDDWDMHAEIVHGNCGEGMIVECPECKRLALRMILYLRRLKRKLKQELK